MEFVAHIVVFICIYAILAISYNLLVGYGGLFSFAHAAFYGIGAYVCTLLGIHLGLNFFVCMIGGCLAAMIVGAIVAIPSLRVASHYLVVFTLGIQVVLYEAFVNLVDITGGEGGLRGIAPPSIFGMEVLSIESFMIFALIFAAICMLIALRLVNSPFGRMLKATRDDPVAAQSLGKDVMRVRIAAFVLSTMLAAVAGALYAHYMRFINPYTFSLGETIVILTLIIVGGRGNIWGSVIGAAILIAIPEAFAFLHLPAYVVGPGRQIFYGALLIGMMFFRPQGILAEHRGQKAGTGLEARPPPVPAPELSGGDSLPPATKAKPKRTAKPILEAKGIYKSFGGLKAVDNFSVSLSAGEITSLVGPNGAGKTTAFNVVTGFLSTDSGKVYYQGKDITNLPPHRGARLGFVRSFQDVRLFYNMTALENVLVAGQNQPGENLFWLFFNPWKSNRAETENKSKAMAYLKALGLSDRANDVAEDLSFPEQKLLSLARLVATECDVLLLDEPCSSLDPVSMDKTISLVRNLAKQDKAILVIEHNLDVVRSFGERVFFLDQGKTLAMGTAAELMADPELTKIYFGA